MFRKTFFRHLNSSNLTKISRPTLLITDALNTKYSQGQRKAKDAQLLSRFFAPRLIPVIEPNFFSAAILETMRRDGNVLICVDTAGRVLELALLLEQLWRNEQSGLFAYSLALLNNFSEQVIEFARSQVEWMSDKIVRQFEETRANPFNLRYVKLCHDLNALEKVRAPKVKGKKNRFVAERNGRISFLGRFSQSTRFRMWFCPRSLYSMGRKREE